MEPEKAKKNSDTSKADSEKYVNEMKTDNNSDNEQSNSEIREPEERTKPKWDDRQIDFDQLIF